MQLAWVSPVWHLEGCKEASPPGQFWPRATPRYAMPALTAHEASDALSSTSPLKIVSCQLVGCSAISPFVRNISLSMATGFLYETSLWFSFLCVYPLSSIYLFPPLEEGLSFFFFFLTQPVSSFFLIISIAIICILSHVKTPVLNINCKGRTLC